MLVVVSLLTRPHAEERVREFVETWSGKAKAGMAKVKGTGMLARGQALRVRRNHVGALLPERLRHYLEEKILVASWYPAEDLLDLLRTLVHFVPKGIGNAWWWMGEQSAWVDLAEVYSAMVQKGNAWASLQRVPRLWRLYQDSGKVEVGVAGSTRAQVILTEYAFAEEELRQPGGRLPQRAAPRGRRRGRGQGAAERRGQRGALAGGVVARSALLCR